jgi:hypothetical protein
MPEEKKNNTDYTKASEKKVVPLQSVKNTEGAETDEKKRPEKIISGDVVVKKPGLFTRTKRALFGEEGSRNVGKYVAGEIVVPAIKNIIVDTITSGINILVYGENGSNNRSSYGQSSSYANQRSYAGKPVNYGAQYKSGVRSSSNGTGSLHLGHAAASRSVRTFNSEDYILPTRRDAVALLDALSEIGDQYDTVTLADFYDLVGKESVFTDNNFGWTIDEISYGDVRPARSGYVVVLSQVHSLV